MYYKRQSENIVMTNQCTRQEHMHASSKSLNVSRSVMDRVTLTFLWSCAC